jgi:DNA-nicking Smr family endonuclease
MHAESHRMPPRPRKLTDQDNATWADFARHVRLLPGRQVPPESPSLAPRAVPAAPRAVAPPPPRISRPAYLETGLQPAGLDNASWNRFRAGKLAPARTLDLHGKTAQAAFHLLERFLAAACTDRLRCVEVITGRGSGEAGGVIRRELPLWLNLPALRPHVLAAAHPHAANTGATRLLLRRARG